MADKLLRLIKHTFAIIDSIIFFLFMNIFINRLDKHWCKRAFLFHYDSDAFEELCSDIQGSGLSGKHWAI